MAIGTLDSSLYRQQAIKKHPKTFSMRKKMGVEEVVESVMIEADLIKKGKDTKIK